MSAIPIVSNFQHDFVLQIVLTDTEATMDEVAAAAAYHSVGRRVAAQPGRVVRVRRQGDDQFIQRGSRLKDIDVKPMETFEFIFADS